MEHEPFLQSILGHKILDSLVSFARKLAKARHSDPLPRPIGVPIPKNIPRSIWGLDWEVGQSDSSLQLKIMENMHIYK